MSELKPCPFCGSEAWAYPTDAFSDLGNFEWVAQCKGEGNHTLVNSYETKAEAIAAWNSRAERTCHETMIDKYFRGCDSCGWVWEVFYSFGKRERPNYCPNCGAKVVTDGQ